MRTSITFQRIVFGITAVPLFCLLTGCYLNFFKTNTKTSITADEAKKLREGNKYFIIHFQNSTKGLEQAYVTEDTLHGKIVDLPPQHAEYLYPKTTSKTNTVKRKYKNDVLMEVHLYTNATWNTYDSVFASSVTSFQRADVYELNKGATTANHVLSTVGIITGSVLTVGLIIVAASCNCPQVYVENNGNYNFTSGLYSGAVYSTLERTDYLPLKNIAPGAKNISLRIMNAKNEEQFINNVSLLQVTHAAQTHVLTDRHGNIFSYNSLQLPFKATTGETDDIRNILSKTDEQYYSFDNAANKDGFSDVTFSFDKPLNAAQAKLVIHARNTYWGGLLHKEMLQYFGDNFEKWRTKQEKADPKELEKWQTDQALPLMLYVKKKNEWEFVDYFPLVGNTASRDMIMSIDTKDITGDKLEIKLETTYRFWDLDFAAIDYSTNENFTTTVLQPKQIIKSDSTDQTLTLMQSDKDYVHLTGNEFISFSYAIPESAANTSTSLFLVSGGYYHSIEPITGKTNYTELYKLQKAGAFDKFSREKYKEAQDIVAALNGE